MFRSTKTTRSIRGLAVSKLVFCCVAGVLSGIICYDAYAIDAPNVPDSVIQDTAAIGTDGIEDQVPMPLESTKPGPAQFLWPTVNSRATSYRGHTGNGVDFVPGGGGHPIYASASGIVTMAARSEEGYGHFVVLDHGGGYQTVYAHLNEINVEEGDTVEAGDIIATMGRSGDANGNHLHFEVRRNGDCLPPLDFINAEDTLMDFPH